MVWNSSSSTLYKAVERHNNAENISEEAHDHIQETKFFSPPPHKIEHKEHRHDIKPNDPISGIFQDRDALLITVLIIILWHEKADIKLILALAFVLLG